ncbi:hypothetical protein PENSTE_c013G02249 [Penicillium steckii]|uniref:Major facilitator superfamily (MFS) profile domain-containing protein n=1 Tax=Penicillium steckii TaxID=303698 RepID=A0A1V6T3R8_9EURO|nr:hypothetical protein PENSTE_c013G02249 [Penicillium steckii]
MDSSRSAWSMVTPMLLFSCFCLLVGDILFGYDTGSFGGILANPISIISCQTIYAETREYSIDSLHTSLLTSLAFIGKFVGCLFAGPAIENYGHRMVFFGLSIISVIGIIIEMTSAGSKSGSGRIVQFIVGRIVVYISVGLVEVNVTIYQSEIVPAFFRGFVVLSLQLFLTVGSILASVLNKVFSTSTDSVGWKTITGIQFVFPVLIVVFTFFIPTSPRWLLSKDRNEEAVISLRRLRPKVDTTNGNCEAEISSIRESLQQDVHKTSWFDLIRGTNLRRTMIVIVYYFFQQATGQVFVSTYSVVFYKTNGYAEDAFTYSLMTSCLGFLAVLPAMYTVDRLGRRSSLMISFFLQTLWLFILSGIGDKGDKSSAEKNAVVAVFMLFSVSYNMGGASIPYLIGAEVPNAAVREKTQAIGTSWNVLWAFVTNFALPYMINSIHFGVGWVFGSLALLGLLFTFFFLPETKGRSLEDIDAVFSVPFSPFRSSNPEVAWRCRPIEGKPHFHESI